MIDLAKQIAEEGIRPEIPENIACSRIIELMKKCWHSNPSYRPSFNQMLQENV